MELLLLLSSAVGYGIKSYLLLQRYCPVPAAVGNCVYWGDRGFDGGRIGDCEVCISLVESSKGMV